MMQNEQMELSLAGGGQSNYSPQRDTRSRRAAWWFAQMRELVSNAIDWEAAPEPRPEQSWLRLSHRRLSA
jgi:hypothetical protein